MVKEEDKIQILTSFIGSVSKMLLHTSIIGIFEQHDISYKELKSIINSQQEVIKKLSYQVKSKSEENGKLKMIINKLRWLNKIICWNNALTLLF